MMLDMDRLYFLYSKIQKSQKDKPQYSEIKLNVLKKVLIIFL